MNQKGFIAKYILLGFSIGCACFLLLILLLASSEPEKEVKQTRYGNFKNEDSGEVAGVKDPTEEDKDIAFAMETAKNGEAEKYCAGRENNNRYFPVILEVETGESKHKRGNELTLNECRKNIDFLYDIKNQLTLGITDINEGKFSIGMKEVELQFSIGMPNDVNTTKGRNYERKQYVYNKGSSFENMYFYFENGVLASYQDF